jgi:glyoxylase-like metal-dependent hydrolase (beta-lactamase superfamily II)
MVDAGCGRSQDKLLSNIRSCNIKPEQIEYLLITHCHFDHTGGVKTLKEILPVEIVAHELEAPFLEQGDNTVTAAKWYGAAIQPFHIDRKLSGPRENIDLGGRQIEAIHTPGHSPGSVVYLTESDGNKVLFGQDVHGPVNPIILSDRDDYLRSLELLISLDADILCEGHFGIYKGKADVRKFIESFLSTA